MLEEIRASREVPLDRDELIPLVSALLAQATARNDLAVVMVCEQLGLRLVQEGEQVAAAQVLPPSEVKEMLECPACAARRVKRTELQRKWRNRKKGTGKPANHRRIAV